MEEAVMLLSESLQRQVNMLSITERNQIEEIRIRIHRPLEVVINGKPYYPDIQTVVQYEEVNRFLNKVSKYSLYTLEEELRRGFITIKGGHRVGIAGKVITEGGVVKAVRDVTSFNIRIAREKIGVASRLIPYLYDGRWKNTLLIGPPKSGKTTILRDLARLISTGDDRNRIKALNVGIVDERSEIAGCVNGVPQHTFGIRLDVLDGCPKAEGMMMMIRSMSPQVLIVDEIGRHEDVEAILDAMHTGIHIIVTAHGFDINDVKSRPNFEALFSNGVFDRYIELSARNGAGTIETVRNKNEQVCKRVLEVTT
ncbi:stage III sporulation protein AA [Bacillus solimangrovi]|uniref:Stage III sporulation protein AA n=1 Tax=Bacillus solimangrovi TaxID=1305675 RepID=A0A1E5LK86_9BACI|nr:stage III sporulation protein AA [Bacillus solimangrovi]OEH94481.1 stage III sporulation protein AA [Bacillus solimangrovi]